MDAHPSRRDGTTPTVLSLAFLQDMIAYAPVSPAALGFWFWVTNTRIDDDDILEAARARFGLDQAEVAVLIAELRAAGFMAWSGEIEIRAQATGARS